MWPLCKLREEFILLELYKGPLDTSQTMILLVVPTHQCAVPSVCLPSVAGTFMGILCGGKHLNPSSRLVVWPFIHWDTHHFIASHPCGVFWLSFLGFRRMPVKFSTSNWVFQPQRCSWPNTQHDRHHHMVSMCLEGAVGKDPDLSEIMYTYRLYFLWISLQEGEGA